MTALAGCGGGFEARIPSSPDGLPSVPVDIHNHIFNATDIPIAGFAEQVLIRDPETPVEGGPSLVRSLVQLIVDIVLAAKETPTAAAELDELKGLGRLPARDGGDLLRQDQRAVAGGLRVLEVKAQTSAVRRIAPLSAGESAAAPTGDEILFSQLAAQSGVDANTISTFERSGADARPRRSQADQIAASLYRDRSRQEPSTFTTLADRTTPDQSFAQTLRWAGLLTRSRVDILGELIRLYAHRPSEASPLEPTLSNGIKVFSPSLVDFTYWLGAADDRDEDQTGADILDQMRVLSRIAKLERSALILPFAPFCPLRAAVYRKGGRGAWLEHIKQAVTEMGFAGVKLYPPMGFLPLGNTMFDARGQRRPEALRRFGISGSEIDRELTDLYTWCAAEEVPIKTHGNNSLGADACTGQNAAAENWNAVLQTPGWEKLRLNIAHFGGFEERFDTEDECPAEASSYESQATDMINAYDNIYVDLGYWTEVTGSNRTQMPPGVPVTAANLAVRQLLAEQLGRSDRLKTRLMYGSDWSMIGREEQHASYYSDVQDMLKTAELGLSEQEQLAILGVNALSYLGLDRQGKQTARLSRFFAGRPQFEAVQALAPPTPSILVGLRDLFGEAD